EKAALAGTRGVTYVLGDACDLPFADGSFDAVTSYTGIGVLPDPGRGLAEMVRVCRPGGTVSVMEPVVGAGGSSGGLEGAPGAALYPGAAEYQALLARFREVEQAWVLPVRRRAEGIGSRRWPVASLFGLLGQLGLQGLRVDAWGYCTAPDDARVAPERRRAVRQAEYEGTMGWLTELRDGAECAVLEEHGFSRGDLERLIELTRVRQGWVLANPLYDWNAGVSLVMAGRK
ncbi:MAG: Methyltransferase type 11, partial [Symbiobacteriaceae bacterium]|nr:Methyltransferase type 11 [Symbiobacteriaceae bacterium]